MRPHSLYAWRGVERNQGHRRGVRKAEHSAKQVFTEEQSPTRFIELPVLGALRQEDHVSKCSEQPNLGHVDRGPVPSPRNGALAGRHSHPGSNAGSNAPSMRADLVASLRNPDSEFRKTPGRGSRQGQSRFDGFRANAEAVCEQPARTHRSDRRANPVGPMRSCFRR
jgi:hypothetical protein